MCITSKSPQELTILSPPQSAPQIDLIFGVTHPQHWHSLNLKQNPSHYSAYGILGSNAIKKLQENYGGGVYYNPFVDIHGMVLFVCQCQTSTQRIGEMEVLYYHFGFSF